MKKSQTHCQTGKNMLILQWALRNNLVGIFHWKVHIWRFVQGFVTFNRAIRRRLSSAFSSASSFGSDRWLGVDLGDGECTEGTVSEQNSLRRNSLETGLKVKTSVRTKVGELSNNLQIVMTRELNGILKIIEELLRTQLSDNKITDIISFLI